MKTLDSLDGKASYESVGVPGVRAWASRREVVRVDAAMARGHGALPHARTSGLSRAGRIHSGYLHSIYTVSRHRLHTTMIYCGHLPTFVHRSQVRLGGPGPGANILPCDRRPQAGSHPSPSLSLLIDDNVCLGCTSPAPWYHDVIVSYVYEVQDAAGQK